MKYKNNDIVTINSDGFDFYINSGRFINAVFRIKGNYFTELRERIYEMDFLYYLDKIEKNIEKTITFHINEDYLDYEKKYIREKKFKRIIENER